MPKIIMLRGLPASGKSTWAKEQVAKSGGKIKRVNKDDLRSMLDSGKWSKDNESFVLHIRDAIIQYAIGMDGCDVIVDDTNFSIRHENHLREMSEMFQDVKFEINDSFLKVPLEECIKRDLERPQSVGQKVIKDMYMKYIYQPSEPIKQDENLQRALIVDIDGTLAHMNGRGPYEFMKVGNDNVDETIANIIAKYTDTHKIILLSGRDGECESITRDWLKEKGVPYDELWMRAPGDTRKDSIVKRELFDEHVAGRFYIDFVLDDRNQVVEMWREMGLRCFQVAWGDF